jgi:hypothetical protein
MVIPPGWGHGDRSVGFFYCRTSGVDKIRIGEEETGYVFSPIFQALNCQKVMEWKSSMPYRATAAHPLLHGKDCHDKAG